MWPLITASALAWTCTEASHLYAAGDSSNIERRLRDGWRYTREDLQCMIDAGVPASFVERERTLRWQTGKRVSVPVQGGFDDVVIDVGCGTLTVVGRDEVAVDGYVDDGVAPVAQVDGRRVTLTTGKTCSDLTIRVPRAARVVIGSTGTQVRVFDVANTVEVASASADVTIEGDTRVVEVRALRGDVLVDVAGDVEVDGGEGRVTIGAGPGGTARVKTVAGEIWLWGGPYRKIEAETVSGDIRVRASYQTASAIQAISHEGDVLVGLPEGTRALGLDAAPRDSHPQLPALVEGAGSSSLRPGRTTPGAAALAVTCFDCLPSEIRGLWHTATPSRLGLRRGAIVRATHAPAATDVRVSARSFSGKVGYPTLNDPIPSALGPLLTAIELNAPTLAACGPGMAEPVPWRHMSGRATLTVTPGAPNAVVLPAGGAPATRSCVEAAIRAWTLPAQAPLTVELPLRWPTAP